MSLVFTRTPGESYCRGLRSLLLYLCYIFRALINSLVCWSRRRGRIVSSWILLSSQLHSVISGKSTYKRIKDCISGQAVNQPDQIYKQHRWTLYGNKITLVFNTSLITLSQLKWFTLFKQDLYTDACIRTHAHRHAHILSLSLSLKYKSGGRNQNQTLKWKILS